VDRHPVLYTIMDTSLFKIEEHILPCQHIREYARATAREEGVLELVIKQYTPLSNPNPQPGDVTVIATHGSGLPKVLFYPTTTTTVGITVLT
jgi:hypothetical protein